MSAHRVWAFSGESDPPYTWQVYEAPEVPNDGYAVHLELPDKWRSARVKATGCVDYTRYFNTPKDAPPAVRCPGDFTQSLHICNLDAEIARLQAIRTAAVAWFQTHAPDATRWVEG